MNNIKYQNEIVEYIDIKIAVKKSVGYKHCGYDRSFDGTYEIFCPIESSQLYSNISNFEDFLIAKDIITLLQYNTKKERTEEETYDETSIPNYTITDKEQTKNVCRYLNSWKRHCSFSKNEGYYDTVEQIDILEENISRLPYNRYKNIVIKGHIVHIFVRFIESTFEECLFPFMGVEYKRVEDAIIREWENRFRDNQEE